jgi:hypothetical protein
MTLPQASFWSFFFGNGWWSAGLWLTAILGFGVPYIVAAYAGRTQLSRDLLLFGLVGAGPLVGLVLYGVLLAVADPDPGCTEECWGRLGLVFVATLGSVMWELGVFFGWARRFFRRRLRAVEKETAAQDEG